MRKEGIAVLMCVALLGGTAPVLADCVEECLDDPGENVLELVVVSDPCVAPGDEVVIELWQRNLQELSRGFQAFMQFDPGCVSIDAAAIVPTAEPYGIVILKTVDGAAGTINLIMGVNDVTGQPPTQADALLATMTFTAVGECESIVCFRENNPPTRFSDPAGFEITPCVKFSDPIITDGTAPTIVCPEDMDLQCLTELPDADTTLPEVSDNLDANPVVTWVGDTTVQDGSGCSGDPIVIERVYRATDCAGNYAECTQTFTIMDTLPPTFPPGQCFEDIFIQCESQIPAPSPACVAIEDNCDPNPTIEWVSDTSNEGAGCVDDPLIITRVYEASDACGNTSQIEQEIWVIDVTAPVITCPDDETAQCELAIPAPDPDSISATDNCGSVEVIWVGDVENDGAGCPGDPFIVTRTYRATDACGNYTECQQTFTVIDDQAPVFDQTPADEEYQCEDDVPEPDPSLLSATDNCDSDVEISWVEDEGNGGAGCEADPLIIERRYVACDDCGNCAVHIQTFTVADTTAPEISCPAEVTMQCGDPPPCDFIGGTVSDNCDENPMITCEDVDNGGTGCEDDPRIITRTYRATDFCGNYAECVQTIIMIDTEPPTFVEGCPDDIVVYPDAGECGPAIVVIPPPEAEDNCDPDPVVEGYRTDGRDIDDPFEIGTTCIWWVAEDQCGNSSVCRQCVTVMDENLIEIEVELQGLLASPLDRCIHFELFNCPGSPYPIDKVMTFFTNALDRSSGIAEFGIPCGEYNCVTAQDLLHTLRSTVGLSIVEYEDIDGTTRTKWRAAFVGEDEWLIGGNLDACQNPDDYFIDVLDFGVLSSEWLVSYPDGGNTGCPACDLAPHADIDGDGCGGAGCVNVQDFTFIVTNILRSYQPDCCGGLSLTEQPQPVTEISLGELDKRGLSHLSAGDLNGDGWLNMDDIQAFMEGARPQPQGSKSTGPEKLTR